MDQELLAQGHAALIRAHEYILLGGLLGLSSILAGLVSRRTGAPLLLVFLGLGMLAGEDGPLGLQFNDFDAAYLIGSVALAVILFEGGLRMPIPTLRMVFWPALLLATVGVAVTAAVLGAFISLVAGVKLTGGLLAGAAAAPTDAAAVTTLLRQSGAAVPERLSALLEAESGLNDPMSIFLTIMILHLIVEPASFGFASAALLFVREMAGGALLGLVGGWLLSLALKRLPLESAPACVLAITAALSLFAMAQMLGTSGFLAIYITGLLTGRTRHRAAAELERFLDSLGWLAQIVLFLMLGLLVTPHYLPAYIPAATASALVLIVVARPLAVFPFLLPFGFSVRETAFASWVGLRGAVPIYISFIPALVDPARDSAFFAGIFVLVVASLLIQGWTIAPAARLLGFVR